MYIAIVSDSSENSREELIEENKRLVEAYEELSQKHENLKGEHSSLKEEYNELRLYSGEAENYDLHTLLREAIGKKEDEPLHRLRSYSRYLDEKLPPYQGTHYVPPDGGGSVYVAATGRQQMKIGEPRAYYEARAGVCLTYEEKENFIDKFKTWYELNRAHRNKLSRTLNAVQGGYDETKLAEAKKRKLKAEKELKELDEEVFDDASYHVAKREKKAAYEEMVKILEVDLKAEHLREEIEALNRKLGNSMSL
ncbi:hypothetical protein OAF75_00790 [Verrucomicrobiales bacterium]|nr:hypothetical protein [Verrucomicrobiales bacterium]